MGLHSLPNDFVGPIPTETGQLGMKHCSLIRHKRHVSQFQLKFKYLLI